MKVLQVIHQDPRFPKGGSETYCRHLMNQLIENDVTLGVFCRSLERSAEPLKLEENRNVKYYTVGLEALDTANDIFQFHNSYANPEVKNLFLEVFEDFRPDLVHIHHLVTLSIDIISALVELGIPIVATLHDYWYFCHRITLTTPDGKPCEGPEKGVKCRSCGKSVYNRFPGFLMQPGQAAAVMLRNRRMLRELNQCKILYAPSHTLMARYEKEGISGNLLVHRPYGTPQLAFNKTRSRNPKLTFGYIGGLSPHKGIEVMLDASRDLVEGSWKILIFGQGLAEYESELKERMNGLPVEFCGTFDNQDVRKILDRLDVLVVPSLWEENSPLVVHEACAARVPIVASRLGGLTEIVSDSHGGRLFEPGQTTELADILNELIRNPGKIDRMKKKIKTIRTIEKEVEDIMNDYNRLVEPKTIV